MSATPPAAAAAAAASCVDNSCSNNYMVPKVAMAVGTAHIHNANKPPLATTPSPTSAPVATPGDLFTGAASRLDQLHRVSISCMARALFSFSLHAGACCTDHQALPPAAKRDNRVEGSAKRRARVGGP